MTASLSTLPQYTQYKPPQRDDSELPMSFGGGSSRGKGPPQQQHAADEQQNDDDYDDDDDERAGAHGRGEKGGDVDEDEDEDEDSDDEMGPKPATSSSSSSFSSSSSSSSFVAPKDEPGTDEEDPIAAFTLRHKVPVSHSVDLAGFAKAVSCLSLEPQGNRLCAGSHDGNARLYDFAGMDTRGLAFKAFVPEAGHPVAALCHSPSGDKMLAATGGAQPRVFDREGKEMVKFVRGDMYLRDMANTKGHTMEVTCVAWHPSDKNACMTGSLDGTLRLWDLAGPMSLGMLQNKAVLKLRTAPGQPQGRLGVTACAYSHDGKVLVAGCADGSLHTWSSTVLTRTLSVLRPAHSGPLSGLATSAAQGGLLASRGAGVLLLWSVEEIVKSSVGMQSKAALPFMRAEGLGVTHSAAGMEFSPDGGLVLAGADAPSGGDGGGEGSDDGPAKSLLCFFEVPVRAAASKPRAGAAAGGSGSKAAVPPPLAATAPSLCLAVPGALVALKWARVTNQIVCSSSLGLVRVFFDPALSSKGALLSAGRAPPRKKDPADFAGVGTIFAPHALPMFREADMGDLRKRVSDDKKDAVKQKIPARAPQGPSLRENGSFFFTQYVSGGKKVGAVYNAFTLYQHLAILSNPPLSPQTQVDPSQREDPREALLKLDALTKQDPVFLGRAYASTQPTASFHSRTLEDEAEEVNAKRPRTGK